MSGTALATLKPCGKCDQRRSHIRDDKFGNLEVIENLNPTQNIKFHSKRIYGLKSSKVLEFEFHSSLIKSSHFFPGISKFVNWHTGSPFQNGC